MKRRKFLLAAVVGAAAMTLAGCLAVPGKASAQETDYPNRPVRVVVPYPPGGPTDLIARLAAQMLTETLGQSFFVENVSGGSGVRGAAIVAAAPADGYTLLFPTTDLAIAAVMSSKVGYDPIKDFAPISIVSRSPSVLLLHPSVPAKTIQELVELARADPAKYSYASMSLGQNLLNTERLFRLTLNLPIVRIPFSGAAPILSTTRPAIPLWASSVFLRQSHSSRKGPCVHWQSQAQRDLPSPPRYLPWRRAVLRVRSLSW